MPQEHYEQATAAPGETRISSSDRIVFADTGDTEPVIWWNPKKMTTKIAANAIAALVDYL